MGTIAILAIIVLMLAGAGCYISFRLCRGLEVFFSGIKFTAVLLITELLILMMVLGVVQLFADFPPSVRHILVVFSSGFMGIFVYLLLYTAAADILLAVPKLLNLPFTGHHLFRGVVTATVLILTVITCTYGFVNARQIDTAEYNIDLPGKKDISDMNVVLLSDVHLGALGSESRLDDIVETINAQDPDLVLIAGDFFDTNFTSIQDPEAALKALNDLRSTFGIYACPGNHDAGGTVPQMEDFMKKAGINLLKDSSVVIDDRMVIVGRMDPSPIGGYGDESRKPLSDFFTREDPTLPVIVLDHNPKSVEEYGSEADLVLCGHTHRGQIFPGRLITDLIYTVDYGYYRKNPQSPHVIVTSGVGYWGPPMKVASDSEIVSISFSSGN